MKTVTKSSAVTAGNAVLGEDAVEKSEVVICEVCGYGNPTNVGLCQMCSNYLYDIGVNKNGSNK